MNATENIKTQTLLTYNLKDTLATWYVKNKYTPIMIEDKQESLYEDLFKPSVKTLLQTELCGIPIDPVKVQEAKQKLSAIVKGHLDYFENDPVIKDFHYLQKVELAKEKTSKAKKKIYELDDPIIERFKFNPNSDTQLQKLIYNYLGYTVVDLTKSKKPATGGKTLKKLKANAKCEEHEILFDHLVKLSQANKILTSFIPAFEKAQQLPDGSWRLYGNFNLGGTMSLRLSSSKPNLMQLPSGSVFAKLIKACFISPKGWFQYTSDYAALEDVVNTLQTRDPNKLKIYAEGMCGHCLRAYNYWPDKMPDIDPTSVASINSIKTKYPKLRQLSKAPSFACQYFGTYITLMNNCGFPEAEAKAIEVNYKKMYKVAMDWAIKHIDKAKEIGYVPLAFGGRLRTPLLAQCIPGKRAPYKAQAEGRGAGNALTQSFCILTLRAMNEFMERVWASPYRYQILPTATVHDSIYGMGEDDPKIAKWINDNLIECMAWNEIPELQHPVIKLSSEMDIFYKSWCNPITIENGATEEELLIACKKGKQEFDKIELLTTLNWKQVGRDWLSPYDGNEYSLEDACSQESNN